MSIVLANLSKRYGKQIIVNKVSLQIEDGELFVLLGGSGSGKSTILRMIAGLADPDGGTILLNGNDVTTWPAQKRGTGFVFQNYSIFRHMTVRQNIEFGLRIRKVAPEERRKRAETLLDLVGLVGLGERYTDQLSGGQQQRVALARALAYEPAVLLLDEPFGALDVKIRAQLRASLREIQQKLKVTTVLVTHDQEEAFVLADRIGIIEGGHLIEVGTPPELYHRPRTEYAATFIGSGNVLVGQEEGGQIRLGSASLPMPEKAPRHDAGARVRVMFRPETVLLQDQPFSAESGVFTLGEGEVVERVFAGSYQRVLLAVKELAGVRSIVPGGAYGQRRTRLEALLPSIQDVPAPGRHLWIGVRDFHVLGPTGPKILVCTDGTEGDRPVADFGCLLAQSAAGTATLISVAPNADGVAGLRQSLEAVRQDWLVRLPSLETRVRQGKAAHEMLLETQEGNYEMVVLGKARTTVQGLGSSAGDVLSQAEVPVLLVQEARPSISRVLVCTAAGEPGKADVRTGARLAWRTGASATVMHVLRDNADDADKERAVRHLSQALASMEALEVNAETRVRSGQALENILEEADRGDYDVVVIGAPPPTGPRGADLATRIVNGTRRPVLIVPMVG